MLDRLQKIFPIDLLLGIVWVNALIMVLFTILEIVEKYSIN